MLKIFTPKYRGDLIVILMLFLLIIYFIVTSFLQENPKVDNLIVVIISFIAVIGIIFVNSVIREDPFLTTLQGVYVLIIAILAIGGAYIINQMYGGIFSFFYILGIVFLVLYINDKTTLFEAKQESKYISNQIESEVYRIPSDDSRYIPSEVKNFVFERDHGRCVICGSNRRIHYDHDIPFSKGGSNTVDNIRILCEECNLKKSDKIE